MPMILETTPTVPANMFIHGGWLGIWLAITEAPTSRQMSAIICRTKPRIATTIKPVAGPLTVCAAAAVGAAVGNPGIGGGPLDAVSANSGNEESGLHSVVPSSRTFVCVFARPSAVHLRKFSVGIGSYSLAAAPT